MSSRDWQERIQDILDSVAEIELFTKGVNAKSFRQDQKAVRAVEMNFILRPRWLSVACSLPNSFWRHWQSVQRSCHPCGFPRPG